MSAIKVIKAWHCNDCGLPHGRPYPNVALCRVCRRARLVARERTPRYRRWKINYARSPRGKILHSLWEDQNRERRRSQNLAWYRSHRKIVICRFDGCTNSIIRPKGSHRWMCDDCAVAMYGKGYLTWRSKARGDRWNSVTRRIYRAA